MSRGLEQGQLPNRAVAITFDDGYAESLREAMTALERLDLRATFFITTGYLGGNREFWWDELERFLFQASALPETITLEINNRPHRWTVDAPGNRRADDASEHLAWRAWDEPQTARQSIYISLWRKLREMSDPEREQVLEQLRELTKLDPAPRPSYCPVSEQDVSALANIEVVEIGAHSITHPPLSTLSAALQKTEIEQSKIHLEALSGSPVESFTYPYGDYSEETIRVVRDSGYSRACSTEESLVTASSRVFSLPRIPAPDVDGEGFAQLLSTHFNDLRA
jgi:peptidoglycan/xylan/chitin deacetylase (PgdA/CDA1 family)